MIEYLKNRLNEHSSWAAIGVAITAAAGVASPYSWILIATGIIAVLVPR